MADKSSKRKKSAASAKQDPQDVFGHEADEAKTEANVGEDEGPSSIEPQHESVGKTPDIVQPVSKESHNVWFKYLLMVYLTSLCKERDGAAKKVSELGALSTPDHAPLNTPEAVVAFKSEAAKAITFGPVEQISSRGKLVAYLVITFFFGIGVISLFGGLGTPANPPAWADGALRFIRPVELPLGLDQNWKLFSPDIRGINFHSQAVVTFEDGSTKFYEFPRMEKMGLFEKFRREKMSKLVCDCMPWPDFKAFWPSVARYVARSNANKDNQPVMVSLSYNWFPVPSYEEFRMQDQLPESTNRYTFFIYKVEPEDVK